MTSNYRLEFCLDKLRELQVLLIVLVRWPTIFDKITKIFLSQNFTVFNVISFCQQFGQLIILNHITMIECGMNIV